MLATGTAPASPNHAGGGCLAIDHTYCARPRTAAEIDRANTHYTLAGHYCFSITCVIIPVTIRDWRSARGLIRVTMPEVGLTGSLLGILN
ncbi:MAG: hypothetical protein KF726_03315 [Anaerolineae bacterium]|nr:hypothetical protein [Anaerolineae bacterium]